MAEIAVYAYQRPNGRPNFGDDLGPHILRRLGHKVRVVPAKDADLAACGSVMHHLTRPQTMVWGCGMMSPAKKARVPLNILGVRGTLTAQHMGVSKDKILGDPALLVPQLWDIKTGPRTGVGYVRHYVDTRTDHSWATRVISVEQEVDEVIDQIASCSYVVSSSLHGFIVAQALGIPALYRPHPGVGGGEFKWLDHASSATLPQSPDRLVRALPF